jgi:drug/metabolite transporter (DMT)-like permease
VFGLVGGLVLVACAARRTGREPGALPLAVGLAIVCGVFLAFYWYFNPWEGMLYSSQWMLMVACLIVLGLKRARGAAIAILVVAVAMFVSNEPLTWPTRETFEQACPDDHLPPWEQGPNPATPRSPWP